MKTYLSETAFREVVDTFQWPATYTVESDLPDGMMLKFPLCTLYFAEGPEGDVRLEFLPENTGVKMSLGLAHAMMVAPPGSDAQGARKLFRDESPVGSVDKARHGVHDICTTVLARLEHVLLGDFSWVERYRAKTGL
ncbi:MAG: hypothetical protein ACRBN8_19355 [Nannocystales bacterium]